MLSTTARKIMRKVGCDWNGGYHVVITVDGNNSNDYYSEEEALEILELIEAEEEFSVEVGRFFYFEPRKEEWIPESEIDWDTYTDVEREEMCEDVCWGTEYKYVKPERLCFKIEERIIV